MAIGRTIFRFMRFGRDNRVIGSIALVIATVIWAAVTSPPVPAQPAQIISRGTGVWNSALTWSCNCIPAPSSHILIQAGDIVTVEGPIAAATVTVDGTLQASRAANSTLTLNGNLIVRGLGRLDYGSAASPIPDGVTARIRFILDEARYAGGPPTEPVATDVGLWVVGQGRVTTRGPYRDGWSVLTTSAPARATEITVDPRFAGGWRVGDELMIGPSNANLRVSPEDEVRRIIAVAGNGRFILNAPLTYNHMVQSVPWTDAWGDPWIEHLNPPVANLTRNIIFEAADPNHRPHLMVMDQGRTEIEDLAIVAFSPVPRFVPFARYALHWHGQREGSRGNYARRVVIRDGMGDGVHIHDSYGVEVEDVVIYNQARAYLSSRVQGVNGIELERRGEHTSTLTSDTGANDAWVDRALVVRFGHARAMRSSGIWLAGGVGAYVVGAHTAGGIGTFQSGVHWCEGCANARSADPDNPDRTPRVLRATSHSNVIGFFWWTNVTPSQDILDLLAWNNNRGFEMGAYSVDWRLFGVRAIGNTRWQFAEHAANTAFTGFLADGQNRGSTGIQILNYEGASQRDTLYEAGVVRGVQTAVAFTRCLIDRTCNGQLTQVQLSQVEFVGNPVIRYGWHNVSTSTLKFRNQRGLPRAANFTLFRPDQTSMPGGVRDSVYAAIRVDNDSSGASARPPRVRLISGPSRPECTADDSVIAQIVTLCADTDAPTVEFFTGPRRIAVVSASGGSAQVRFDMRTWPHRRAYFYARAVGANGRINYSRVIRVARPTPARTATPTPVRTATPLGH